MDKRHNLSALSGDTAGRNINCMLNKAALVVADPLGEDSAGEFCRGTYRGEEVTVHKVVVVDENKFCSEIASTVGYLKLKVFVVL